VTLASKGAGDTRQTQTMKPFYLWKQHPTKPVSLWKQRRITVMLSLTLVATAAVVGWLILRSK
jgi:hypothetical protein